MSDPAISQQNGDKEWEHFFDQLDKEWLVSMALKEAEAAFLSPSAPWDAYKFVQACDQLASFLERKIDLDDSKQRAVVQIIQNACAMHENAVNKSVSQLKEHLADCLTSAALVNLCQTALSSGVMTQTKHWCDMLTPAFKAAEAVAKADDALSMAEYLQVMAQYATMSAPPPPTPLVLRPAIASASVQDIADVRLTTPSMSTPPVILNAPFMLAPMTYTMPPLTRMACGSHSSRMDMPSMPPSRGHSLSAVQEAEE